MRYTKYPELKKQLKELAKKIKQQKFLRKPDNRRGMDLKQWDIDFNVFSYKREFRHKHIAYCMLRGTPYEKIENYCNESPDWRKIENIRGEHARQTLRTCAQGSL